MMDETAGYDPIVTAVLRAPAGLSVVVNRISPGDLARQDPHPERLEVSVTEAVVPIEAAPRAVAPTLRPILRAWTALAAVPATDLPIDAVGTLLEDTVPARWLDLDLPPLARVTRPSP